MWRVFYIGKGNVFAVLVMKACRGTEGIAPLILNLDIRWYVVSFKPWPLYSREKSRRLDGWVE
jgi:hypothetical protein